MFKRDTEKKPKIKSLDYYERYYDELNSAENELKTNSKYKNYNPAEIKLGANSKYHEIDPIKLIYYKNPNNNKRPKNNNKIGELIKNYKRPQKEFENNNRLHKQQHNKPDKFEENSTKTPEEYKLIANYILRHVKKNLTQTEYDMMKKIADLVRDDEILKLYFTLQEIEREEAKKQVERTSEIRNELNAFEEVLGDMIKENNKALANYDWLGTAVDLQSAIKKMFDMV